jgi:hypothetical protein
MSTRRSIPRMSMQNDVVSVVSTESALENVAAVSPSRKTTAAAPEMLQSQRGKEQVGPGRNRDPPLLSVEVEQRAQGQEQQVDPDHNPGEPMDVPLRLTERPAAQVLLHHVLIQSRSCRWR